MKILEILRALQAGEISSDEVKKELTGIKTGLVESAQLPNPQNELEFSGLEDNYGVVLSTVLSLNELSLQPWVVPEPNVDEITIQVKASAINFPDTMCVTGLYPTMPDYPFVPGFEVSGIVSRVGRQVTEFAVGDEVIALTGKQMGGHASYVNTEVINVVRKPNNISFEEACSLPVVFSTVAYAFKLAKLAPKEHVLIQTATGGCGLVALQLAHLKGCVCYGTSSKQDKLDILTRLEVPHVINYKTSEFDLEIKRMTNNKGVDVVLNMLSGDAIQKGFNCLGPSGRYLEIAVHALKTSQKLDLSKLVRNQSIYSIDLRQLSFQNKSFVKEMLNLMVSMIKAEQIVPIVSRIYPIHQIKEALEYVGQGQHIGKVVISHTHKKMIDLSEHCIQCLLEHKRNCATSSFSTKTTVSSINNNDLIVKQEEQAQEGIAIIGMAGQFPQSKTLEIFWDNIATGKDCISEIPESRWSIDEYYHPDHRIPGKTYSKWMGIVEDVDKFDPLFFNISPAEAELMDPQQRLFMESCWSCIEDSGLHPAALSGSRCGVFVGCGAGDYGQSMSGQALNAQGLMGGSPSILSARISYFLNLKGPCLAIDTACSSSLVAIAEACNNLVLGNSDLALAGGVSVHTGPGMHIMTSKSGMLSPDGRCFTFDNRANGFVPGEGVGVILLKRLSDAVRDQDMIYGVIRGWGVNQDGKTNGITAPSVNSQIMLEKEVYDRFKISPETISLVEAHGTGTKLGDPIEVEALTEAFQAFTDKKGYCALGSVKSNIGHLLTAAGISGVIKVLLALKHEMLPPTIQFEKLNEHISLENSPFYINSSLQPWKVPTGVPRRATVSALGFSGTNAHLVIEEYHRAGNTNKIPVLISANNPVLFVLSAKSEDQLKEYAKQLKNWIAAHEDISLVDVAYTLQTGREAMDYRLAFLADSRLSVLKELEGYIIGNLSTRVLAAQVKKSKDGVAIFEADEDAKVLLQSWMAKKKLKKIAELWVKGLRIDWIKLYGDHIPGRTRLPTYPFARNSYWLSGDKTQAVVSLGESLAYTASIHPLVQQNTSSLSEQRFTTTFTGKEIFLADHVVAGRHVLPSVAYLEMARVAVENFAETFAEDCTATLIKDVVWAQPIVLGDEPVKVSIALYPEDKGEIVFEIYSEQETNEAELIVHSQGRVAFIPATQAPLLDLAALQVECKQSSMSGAECYEIFKTLEFEYGPGLQGIETVYVGVDKVLAKLCLPNCIDIQDQFVLHPSVMDSALQASIGLMMLAEDDQGKTSFKPMLPFALQELKIISKCTSNMWALIEVADRHKARDKVQTIDITLCDEQGYVCASMKGFSSRVLAGAVGRARTSPTAKTLILAPDWQTQTVQDKINYTYTQHVILLCEVNTISKEDIESSLRGVHCLTLIAEHEQIDKRFQTYAEQAFVEIKTILQSKPKGNVLFQIVTSGLGEQALFAGLAGLLKTAQLENPKFIGQLIEVGEDSSRIVELLTENSQNPVSQQIRYQGGKRLVSCWKEVEALKQAHLPWKDHGIYLITGGAGGLGQIFASEIAHTVKDATLILTGRSALSVRKLAQLQELETLGVRIEYQKVDVTKQQAVRDLLHSIQEKFGPLHGIIHGAGILGDNFILKKTPEELQAVLAPKVTGLVNLDLASKELPLDFFITFSSIAGSLGNAGQADYAMANAFMDAYAQYRKQLVDMSERQGRTLSINWPLWKDGGMHIDVETQITMRKNMGIIPLETSSGIRAMYQGLSCGKPQVMILEGDLSKIKQCIVDPLAKESAEPMQEAVLTVDLGLLREKTMHHLKNLFGEITKLTMGQIDMDEPLESYGIDSIMITQMNQKLTIIFGELSKTLFFEYQTLGALNEYFIAEYAQECMKWTGLEKQIQLMPQVALKALNIESEFPVLTTLKGNKKTQRGFSSVGKSHEIREPIAIIGMSGRYPKAANLKEYWDNLQGGKDCITEIPSDRWKLDGFYNPSTQEAIATGKSYSKWGGFVDGFADFEPLFFNMSPREALNMDPQERLFIETCWEVIEDAGYTREQLSAQHNRRVGVFAGITKTGFSLYGPDLWKQGEDIFPNTSFGALANRVSYLLNLQGPSMPIDTMCSSSLTAIHEACEHLRHGECEMAIAGGVNLYLHPSNYTVLCGQKMLSIDGQCKSFGQGGNGFVPGEGVGCVLLKPLSRAVADKDHIYAVIRGTSINHDGKTNGYTVPSPAAQEDVIRQALDKAGVNARTVSYIEAHGTGTELGDPIEISGLTQAFRKDSPDTGFCAIGSAKSNIGHLEAAAGIAGLSKIVLQMQHHKLVPSLHAQLTNPNIKFGLTPFIVQQELIEWKRPVVSINGTSKEYPRIAGISAFGAGGSNAHVVIEEYITENKSRQIIEINSRNPAIIVLSAKTEERLKEQAIRLLATVVAQEFTEESLADMAYTLQVGREAMEERMAVLVGSLSELEQKLTEFVAGKDGIEDLYRGQVKRNKEALSVFATDEDMAKTIDAWINKRKYGKLLDMWVKGLIFDWQKLYVETLPQRISLPTYAFAKERYWIPEIKNYVMGSVAVSSTHVASIHPLLHQNTSNIFGLEFSSAFTGQEFFMADHVVNNQKVLPGVAYLEMAREAVEQIAKNLKKEHTRIVLTNVVWARAVVVGDEPVTVNIGLYPEDKDEIVYEIYSEQEAGQTKHIVHSEGRAVLRSATEFPILNLEGLQIGCTQSSLSGAQCYEIFKTMGIEYGPGHQGIVAVYVGENQVLAKLCLPNCVMDTQDQYVLHPSLMDSALQASIGVMMLAEDARGKAFHKPILPFALQELEIISKCTSNMWALIQLTDSHKVGDKIQKIDIDLCDVQGNICVRMKGLSSRVLEGKVSSAGTSSTHKTLMLDPGWKEQAIQEKITHAYAQHVVLLCEAGTISRENIESSLSGVRCLTLKAEQQEIDKRFQSYATQVFTEIKTLLVGKPQGNVLMQIVMCGLEEQALFAGLAGLLKTAQLENPKFIGQLIEVGEASSGIIEILKENSQSPVDQQIRYQSEKRLVAYWKETKVSEKASLPWKDHGIYLITGGAGGLGQIFANEIIHKVKNVTLILTGRSALSATKQAQIKELEGLGARIEYQEVDVTKPQAVKNLLNSIQEKFGNLNGIIHGAGVIRDNFILKKTPEELQAVLAPKVTGLVNLDLASQELPLDFFILFSSMAGSVGNPGQADYSAANAFMDAYAHYRNVLVNSSERQGRTLSINWPLWKEGGMHVNVETEKAWAEMGMIAMRTPSGVRALYQGLASGKAQVMVIEGDVVQVLEYLTGSAPAPSNVLKPKEKANVSEDFLTRQTVLYVKEILAKAIKLSPERIEEETSFEQYGIDSIVQMDIIRELEKVTGELPKTLLFEYSNTQELVSYLIKNQTDKLLTVFMLENADVSKRKISIPANFTEIKPTSLNKKQLFLPVQSSDQSSQAKVLASQKIDDIAIIGISGRYPLSNTLEELWENLKAGRNCITEDPRNRWKASLAHALSANKIKEADRAYSGGFLENINHFDYRLFQIAQEQVMELSPELRLFLEIVWETFEDAGYTKLALQELQTHYQRGVGVFSGTMYSQYSWSIPALAEAVLSSNSTDWQIPNRTSHFFDLTGPSISVNSACSSSLTAIHLACESLKQNSCCMAIAGGINLTLDPSKYDSLQRTNFLGSGNQSKSFGTGDGYIPGEGVGAVLLKPLSMAIKDNDRIYAVIKSSFISHSGGRQTYTAPDPKQQTQLIVNSLQQARVDPSTIGYVEAAANGSKLGDPIEIIALNSAFGKYTDKEQYCALGSVKSNLGHLEAASGMSQLSKVLLQMKYQTLVPTINANPRNPNIKLEGTSFYLQEEMSQWSKQQDSQTGECLPHRSMINSFGAGGAYANLIVEEFIQETLINRPKKSSEEDLLFVFSAKTKLSLMNYLKKMQGFLEKQSSVNMDDLAHSLHKINHNLEYRAAIITGSSRDLLDKLDYLLKTAETSVDLSIYISLDQKSDRSFPNATIVQQTLAAKNLEKLAQHWIEGATIDFRKLNESSEALWIDIPKYAFDHTIEFDFNNNNSIMNHEITDFDNEFCLDLSKKILNGELSEEEVEKIIFSK